MSTRNPDQRAPMPDFTERGRQVYEVSTAPNVGMRKGPLLHDEQLVYRNPNIRGQLVGGTVDGEGVGSRGAEVRPYRRQSPQETVGQRATTGPELHGQPSWVHDGAYLASFAQGTAHDGEQAYVTQRRDGYPYRRPNDAEITPGSISS